MLDPAYTLGLTLSRDAWKNEFDNSYVASCVLSVYLRATDQGSKSAPSMSYRFYACKSEEEDDDLARCHITVESAGIRLAVGDGEVQQIHKKERDRLLAFLQELRGVRIHYIADLFGFLKKDGSDRPVVYDHPFPILVETT